MSDVVTVEYCGCGERVGWMEEGGGYGVGECGSRFGCEECVSQNEMKWSEME